MPHSSDHCPFCGSTRVGVFTGRQAKHAVSCLAPACGATGPEGTTSAEAVGRWRTRHADAAPAPPIAEPLWTGDLVPGSLEQALIDRSLTVFRALTRRKRGG